MIRTDEDNISKSARDERGAAKEECADEYLAQLRVSLNQSEEIIAIELEHVSRLSDAKRVDHGATGEDRHLAGEFSGCDDSDEVAVDAHDFNCRCQHDEKERGRLCGGYQNFAALNVPYASTR